jgi:hypothetical protein
MSEANRCEYKNRPLPLRQGVGGGVIWVGNRPSPEPPPARGGGA